MAEPLPEPAFTVSFPGPFSHHDVVVDGWQVPFLRADMIGEDRVNLLLDDRYSLDVSAAEAERFLPFLADAISIALGYPCHPRGGSAAPARNPHPRPARMLSILAVETDGPPT